MGNRARWTAAALWFLVLAPGVSFDGWAEASGAGHENRRVVAVGDIHGALDSLRQILESTDLIDADGRWIGGDAVFVQTGDFLDRGVDSVPTAEFLKRLQKEADDAGGEAIVLLGNHEAMNLIGDLRYVAPEEYAQFVDEKSEKRRQAAAKKYADFMRRRASRMRQPKPDADLLRQQWLERRPLGYVERMETFAEGDLFRWLKGLPAAARFKGTVFLHGGIHPDLADWSLDRINRRIGKEIANFAKLKRSLAGEGLILPFFDLEEMETSIRAELDHARKVPHDLRLQEKIRLMEDFLNSRSWLIRHPDGPLWFRGFAKWSPDEEELLAEVLRAQRAERFVVGHSTTASRRIETRFDGRVVLIDTGMLSAYYKGEPSALEIEGQSARALYARELEAPAEPSATAVAAPARRDP